MYTPNPFAMKKKHPKSVTLANKGLTQQKNTVKNLKTTNVC